MNQLFIKETIIELFPSNKIVTTETIIIKHSSVIAMPPPCVFGCTNYERVHIFPDPNKYPDRFRLWLELAGIKVDPTEDITVYRRKRVCSNHFTEEHRTRNNRLSAIAVPTLNLKKRVVSVSPSNTVPSYMPIIQCKDPKEERVKRLLNVYKDSVKNLVGSPYSSDQNSKKDSSPFMRNENEVKRPASPTLKVKTCNKVYARRKSLTSERKLVTKPVQSVMNQEFIVPKQGQDENSEDVQELEKCIICEQSITQSHYICVECADVSMCEPCAVTCEHNQHYMLRIPNPKPQSEVKPVLERLQKQLLTNDFEQSCNTDYSTEIENATTPTVSKVTNSQLAEERSLERVNPLFEGDIPEPNEDIKESLFQDVGKDIKYEEHYMIGTEDLYNMQNSTSYTIVGLDNLIESNGPFDETASYDEYSDEQFDTGKRKYEDASLETSKLRAVLRKCDKDNSSQRTKLTRVELFEYLVPHR